MNNDITLKIYNNRNVALDMLKGISIIAVVLYHMGLLKSGYLGVDCFFVISGFLTMPKIINYVEDGSFKFFKYIRTRIVRLLPAMLLVSILSLAIGYALWLPNDYENLAESVIASTFFSNNILSGITTKNYWDSINEYKPLMHMWYVGILMEYYIVQSIVVVVLMKLAGVLRINKRKTTLLCMGVITAISFLLFLMPCFSTSDKFYYIPFRFWELSLGGFVGILHIEKKNFFKNNSPLSFVPLGIILVILCIGLVNFDISNIGVATTIIGADTVASSNLIFPNSVLLISIVFATCLFIVTGYESTVLNRSKILSAIGKRSYSVFVWHQFILALYRYSISNKLSIQFVVCFFILLSVISELNYRIIELKINNTDRTLVSIVAVAVFICGYSGIIYLRAGVVRDVPELAISTSNIQRNMHSKYCDRIYSCKDEFDDNGKINVLIIGNSFARDWGNILLESEYSNDMNLYFSVHFDQSLLEKIKAADRIFVFENFEDKVPDYVWDNVDSDIVYCIGTKNFGVSNGTIYSHRFYDDYFNQTVSLDPGYKALNQEKKEKWGDHYIDLIEPVLVDGKVRVFSDDNMFLSQDCRHLTEAGAKYYAKILNLSQYMP